MILEVAANAVTTLSIFLAVKNSIHTWWTGIVGALLFLILFYFNQLYADSTLQAFFVVTSIMGWWQWKHVAGKKVDRPISKTTVRTTAIIVSTAIAVTFVYGWLLKHFTNDFMPYVDASVLALSVTGQCLLMQRKIESWWVWVLVNTISVPLYISRGMYITAILYAVYWFNAWFGLMSWRIKSKSQMVSA